MPPPAVVKDARHVSGAVHDVLDIFPQPPHWSCSVVEIKGSHRSRSRAAARSASVLGRWASSSDYA